MLCAGGLKILGSLLAVACGASLYGLAADVGCSSVIGASSWNAGYASGASSGNATTKSVGRTVISLS